MLKERLNCEVTAEVREGMEDLGRSLQRKKGGLTKAYKLLISKAFANPTAPILDFPGEEVRTCTLEADAAEQGRLNTYQDLHRISERRKAFKKALLQGYSVYLREPKPVTAPNPKPGS